jgi:flagellar motility protein MotE (MotC chaperone)
MKKIPLSIAISSSIFGLLAFIGAFWAGLHFSGALKWKPSHPEKVVKADEAAAKGPSTVESVTLIAKQLDAWNRELTTKQKNILEMDQDLLRRENLLKAEREALTVERQKLSELQGRLESRFVMVEKNEVEKLGTLAELYNTMKPEDGAKLMRELADDQATKILSLMKTKTSARLLESWGNQFSGDRPKIARLLDRMRLVVEENSVPGNKL